MRSYAFALCAFYLAAKTYVRFWLFRPIQERPIVTRPNEILRLIDLAAILALAGAFFFMLNTKHVALSVAMVLGLVGYDVVIRFVFLRLEIMRLRSSQPKLGRRDASHRVRRRAQTPAFH